MVVRTKLECHSLQINKKEDGTQFFMVANDIPLEVFIDKKGMKEKSMKEIKEYVNAMMLNSCRYIKHTGDLPRQLDLSVLDKWSSTDTGIAIKVKNDECPEFPRFL